MLHPGRSTYVCLLSNLNFSDYYRTRGVSHLFFVVTLVQGGNIATQMYSAKN